MRRKILFILFGFVESPSLFSVKVSYPRNKKILLFTERIKRSDDSSISIEIGKNINVKKSMERVENSHRLPLFLGARIMSAAIVRWKILKTSKV